MALYDFVSRERSKGLLKVMKDNKWGLIKEDDYTEVVEPTWDSEPSFKEDYIIVKHQDKYGAIDENGKEIIPITNKHLDVITKDRLWVCNFDDKIGVLDFKGNVLVPLKYTFLQVFDDDHIVVEHEASIGMIDINNNVLLPFEYTYIILNPNCSMFECRKPNGMCGLINKDMKEIVPFEYNSLFFYGGYIVAVKKKKKAVYDLNGNKLIDPVECKRIWPACEGYFIVSDEDDLQGIIKADGNIVAMPIYEEIKYLGEGLFGVCKQTVSGSTSPRTMRIGIIDLEGKEVLPFKYTSVEGFRNGFSKIILDGKVGVINTKCKVIVPFKYTNLKHTSDSSYFVAKKGEKWGIITSKGEELTPFIYDEVFDVKWRGIATVEYKGNKGEVIL